jgi:ribosome-binding factor A
MRQRKSERLTETIREEVDGILHTRISDPRLGFVTITRAKVSADGTHAFIFYSTLGTEEQRASSQEAMDSSKGYIRKLLAGRLRVRAVPELHFIHDTSVEKGEEVLKLLREIEGS